MNLHGAFAVEEAHALAVISARTHRLKARMTGQQSTHETESPTVAYYVVCFASAFGFLIMCAVAALG
jgi:hypothetical protein